MIQSTIAVIQFELSRFLTAQRLMLAVVMILFPPFMSMLLYQTGAIVYGELAAAVLCGMTCLLSLLLWATPNVYSELEGRSWTFVTSRPWGRVAIVVGKYLIAAGWAFGVSFAGLTLILLTLEQEVFMTEMPRFRLWLYLGTLLFLASFVYAAVFSLFGVVVQRRAMVISVVWFVLFEIVFAMIPAVIGKFSMTFHLFSLLLHWVSWIFPGGSEDLEGFGALYGLYPTWVHLLAIFAMTGLALGASIFVVRWREYLTLEDSQV